MSRQSTIGVGNPKQQTPHLESGGAAKSCLRLVLTHSARNCAREKGSYGAGRIAKGLHICAADFANWHSAPTVKSTCFFVCSPFSMSCLKSEGFGQNGTTRARLNVGDNYRANLPPKRGDETRNSEDMVYAGRNIHRSPLQSDAETRSRRPSHLRRRRRTPARHRSGCLVKEEVLPLQDTQSASTGGSVRTPSSV